MTPEIILVCITLVTNSASETLVSHDCHAQPAAEVARAVNSFEQISLRSVNDLAPAQAPAVVQPVTADVKVRSTRRHVIRRLAALTSEKLRHRHRWHARKADGISTAAVSPASDKRTSFWDILQRDAKKFSVRFKPFAPEQ